jgi:beta-N-acetylhexosaminidase
MKHRRIFFVLSLITLLVSPFLVTRAQSTEPPFLRYMNNPWVDSVMTTLDLDHQIAQCIWVAGYSGGDIAQEVEISDLIKRFGIGGIVFFQGTAEKQAKLTNYYQSISKVPLIIALDAEWGVGMRLLNVDKFPFQMTLGAIANDSLIYAFGKDVAMQFKRLGMQVNFAPVADVNVNPRNPVINFRSFGENRDNVANKATMYMEGMQDNGICATGKHFPGHGDTNVDSHLDLPVITHNRARLDSIELYPFRKLIANGIGSIMVAHLNLPSLDTTSGLPSTLSHTIVSGLLKNELEYKGLIVTDAMNMKGVTKYFKTGEADAKALEAGNDVAEFVTDVEATIRETKNYIRENKLSTKDISMKCRKILALKYWAGLNSFKPVETRNIDNDLTPGSNKALIRDLYANALTLLSDKDNLIPIKKLDNIRIASLAINCQQVRLFQKRIGEYIPVDNYTADLSDTAACRILLGKLEGYDMIIAGVYDLNQYPNKNFGIKPGLDAFLDKLVHHNRTIITWFGNPYSVDKIEALRDADALILAYQENDYTEDLSAQLIFGGIGARGRLPVTINEKWPYNFGIKTEGNLRLQYGFPENAGISSDMLKTRIDSIVKTGLDARAYPGCEVIIARNGIVVFHKTYGYHTYDDRIAVQDNDLYDLASVTKVSSTLAGLMLLNSEGRFSPDKTLGYYLPYFRRSDKGDIVMRDFLAHQAGLTPFISFWKETLKKDGEYKKRIYHCSQTKRYPYEVAQGLYINRNYREKMFSEIRKSHLGPKKYVYSDLTFIIAPDIITKVTGEKWYKYVTDSIYKRIGAYDLVFNPYLRYSPDRIVPTEYDSLFRKQQLWGTVHDEGAAMQGGISGHAGLFATANDLLKLMELYRRMGNYGGEQIISKPVIEEYSRVQFPGNDNRRGLGFDKPLLNNSDLSTKEAYPAKSASKASFGHSGYTGTFVWVDPKYGISYVFLCNRVYPTRYNNRLYDMNIRSAILQATYDSIIK